MPQIPIGDPDPPETPGSGKTYIPFYPYPFSWPWFPWIPLPQLPQPQENRCPRCGIKWEGVMGYVCQDLNCPMQPRITW